MNRSDVIERLGKLTKDANGGPVNYTSFPLDDFDREIRRASQSSAKTPAEFLEAELRRDLNYWLLNHGDSALRGSLVYPTKTISWKAIKAWIEEDYQAYFNTQTYYRTLTNMTLDPDNFTITIPQNRPEPVKVEFGQPPSVTEDVADIYGNDNEEIKADLRAYGLPAALRTLGFGNPFNPVTEVTSTELPEMAKRYLIAIGCLFPQDERVIVHPNMKFGNRGGHYPGIQPTLDCFEGLRLAQNYIPSLTDK